MSNLVAWIAAEAEEAGKSMHGEFVREIEEKSHFSQRQGEEETTEETHFWRPRPEVGHPGDTQSSQDRVEEESERERRIYRGWTVAMLRRYFRYSMETGRMPSILGREFFRAKVTSYTVVTFEDRVIFVHDMEKCLGKLDEFSRQLIARHILQEHDRWATAKLLHCNEKTVRRLVPLALDQLSEILLDMGLMERLVFGSQKPCQGGMEDEKFVSDCEDDK